MNKIFKIIPLFFSLVLGFYVLIPTPSIPNLPPQSLRSNEPADTETVYRYAYFTNWSREEVINYYKGQFQQPFIRQILPPENSFMLIRDQTKSSWLEEFIHPLKDNLYVNGFYPTKPTEQINIDGVHYKAKITVRYVPSHPVTRVTVVALAGILVYLLIKEYAKN